MFSCRVQARSRARVCRVQAAKDGKTVVIGLAADSGELAHSSVSLSGLLSPAWELTFALRSVALQAAASPPSCVA